MAGKNKEGPGRMPEALLRNTWTGLLGVGALLLAELQRIADGEEHAGL